MSYTREYIEQTLLHLQRILQRHLELMDLHTYNTEEKMMGMLRRDSGEDWKTEYILELSKNNKIKWVRGIDDPTPRDEYQKGMNDTLTEILETIPN